MDLLRIFRNFNCNLLPLDRYKIEIIWPGYQNVVCAISVNDQEIPDVNIIAKQCPDQSAGLASGDFVLEFAGSRAVDPQPPPICPMPHLEIGSGFDDLPAAPASLQTSEPYALLAGDLIWNGLVKPKCGGWSGLDPSTHAANECGIELAMPQLIEWQNRLDPAIYSAASQVQVPPRLLKGLIAVESQFWPLVVGTQGESGMIQLTDPGADISLRYSPTLYAFICPLAIHSDDCHHAYSLLSQTEQAYVRYYLLSMLKINNSLGPAVVKA